MTTPRTCACCNGPLVSRLVWPNTRPISYNPDVHADPFVCVGTLQRRIRTLQDQLDHLEASPLAAVVAERDVLRSKERNQGYRIAQLETLLAAYEDALKSAFKQAAVQFPIWNKMDVEPEHRGVYIGVALNGNGDGFHYESLGWLPWADYGIYAPNGSTRHFTGDCEWFCCVDGWPPLHANPAAFLRWAYLPMPFLEEFEQAPFP